MEPLTTIFSIISILLAIISIWLAIYLFYKAKANHEKEKEQIAKQRIANSINLIASENIALDKTGQCSLKIRNESMSVGISELHINIRIINRKTKKACSLKEINIVGGLRAQNETTDISDRELKININVLTINKRSLIKYQNANQLELHQEGQPNLLHLLKDRNTYLQLYVTAINEKTKNVECAMIKSYDISHIKEGHFCKGEMDVKEEDFSFN